jgi:pimeloyl-ACP methyl ester carboxylesterase
MQYVLVHGAAHTGEHFAACAETIRAAGHAVFCPTLTGNRPGDDPRTTTLEDAIESLIAVFEENSIADAILLGHSWGGIPITAAADRLGPSRVRRLVYFSAFVPNDGESLLDMVPAHYRAMFTAMGEAAGTVSFPFPVLREAFVNDGTVEQAKALFDSLVPQPFRTFTDPVRLTRNPAAFEIGKSFLLPVDDIALPHSAPFHPRLSEKLGLFRLITMPGSHSVFLTAPELLGRKILEAGRD